MRVRFATQQRDKSGLINYQVKYFTKANSAFTIFLHSRHGRFIVCFRIEILRSQSVYHLRRCSARGQNMQISTVDVIRCVNLQAIIKEWEVFCYWRACFSELQNTAYTEGTVLLIFSKDEVKRADCCRSVWIHCP